MELKELENEDRSALADFLNDIRLKHRITFKEMYACIEDNLEIIEGIESIFNLKNEDDAQILITIPQLLFSDSESNDIMSFIKAEKNNKDHLKSVNPDLEQYKVLILSSFVYNPSFFTMVWNWCGFIRRELGLRHLRIIKPLRRELIWLNDNQQLQAASSKGPMKEVYNWPLKDNNIILGELYIQVTPGEIRFVFKFMTYSETLPCYISVQCKTNDGKEYSDIMLKEIDTNNPKTRELIIISDYIPDFDFSAVKLTKVERIDFDRTTIISTM